MKHTAIRFTLLAALCSALLAAAHLEASAADRSVSYARDVRPIFVQHCLACHGGVKQASDLSFVYRDQALAVIEPGDPDESELIFRVTSEDDDLRMPPAEHGAPLQPDEVEVLREWIRQGAAWGGHWAFEKPEKKKAPDTSSSNWPRKRIDRFVFDRLEREGMKPSPDAAADRWQRRVSLDLIGIPPTPIERERFLTAVAAEGEAAYRDEVERLLASVHFGERWASIWLDVMRYADSQGLGLDRRRTIWKYRDWVIRSFNQDLPFDQFTIKQIGGDLLPSPTIDDLVATACHRLTQTNEEGGTDDEQFRVEAVIDRVNTTWQAWQGLTFGCTQCHSHPYEPIRHEEYYQFMAFFNNTADSDLGSDAPNVQVPLEPSQQKAAMRLDQRIRVRQVRDWQAGNRLLTKETLWHPMTDMEVKSSNETKVEVEQRSGVEEFRTRGTVSQDTTFTIEAPIPDGMDRLTAIRFTGLPLDPETARKDSEWGFVVSHFVAELVPPGSKEPVEIKLGRVIADEPEPLLDPQLSLKPKSPYGFGAFTRIHHPRQAAFVLKEPLEVVRGSRLRLQVSHRVLRVAAFPLVTRRGRVTVTGSKALTSWLTNKKLVAVRKEVKKLQAERKAIKSIPIPVMRERPALTARPNHVFDRGNFLSKTDLVEPGTPDCLPPLADEDTPNRLDLANWLASEENPLTARVIVNRIWSGLFGIGLVETQEDFGATGSAPSHPELLDDLAVRFTSDMGWSIKQLLRELTLSSTYRQSAHTSSEQLEKDPQNRLLGRGPRNRLPAETVRDQALAIAGLLTDQPYGPPVHPPIPAGVWQPFSPDGWKTPDLDDPQRYRRSIYTYTKRSIPYPMFDSFDMPSREFCSPRRLPSNTPLQALMMLNDTTYAEASAALANRMLGASEVLEEQLRFGIRLATCREPRSGEVKSIINLYQKTRDQLQQASVKKKESKNDEQLLAMTNVASVLLNLDEVLCK